MGIKQACLERPQVLFNVTSTLPLRVSDFLLHHGQQASIDYNGVHRTPLVSMMQWIKHADPLLLFYSKTEQKKTETLNGRVDVP